MSPNPITENIFSYTYFGDKNSTVISIRIFDLKGKKILSMQSTVDSHGNYKGNLSLDLSSGIYILQSVLDSGISESKLITIIK